MLWITFKLATCAFGANWTECGLLRSLGFTEPRPPWPRCAIGVFVRGVDMNVRERAQPEPLPPMWRVLLFRIWQSEQRDRILSDWQDNVFGFRLLPRERRPH